MNANDIIMWVFIGVDILILLGLIFWGVYATWLDKRLRVIIVDSKSGLNISKQHIKNDIFFSIKDKSYIVDKKAVYRRFFRIPYSLYFSNNPNPIIIEKESNIHKNPEAVYTAQELHALLETNYTLNLIRGKVNVKRIVIGLIITVAILAVIMVILHFTGVIDLRTFFTGGK